MKFFAVGDTVKCVDVKENYPGVPLPLELGEEYQVRSVNDVGGIRVEGITFFPIDGEREASFSPMRFVKV